MDTIQVVETMTPNLCADLVERNELTQERKKEWEMIVQNDSKLREKAKKMIRRGTCTDFIALRLVTTEAILVGSKLLATMNLGGRETTSPLQTQCTTNCIATKIISHI